MAALIRGVIRLLPVEKNVFLSTRSDIIVESKRFVRGLRRKPVRVLFPDNDAGKVVKPQQQQAAEKKEARTSPTAGAGEQPDRSDAVNMRSETAKQPHANITKDSVDGLRYERALPGDKRLS